VTLKVNSVQQSSTRAYSSRLYLPFILHYLGWG